MIARNPWLGLVGMLLVAFSASAFAQDAPPDAEQKDDAQIKERREREVRRSREMAREAQREGTREREGQRDRDVARDREQPPPSGSPSVPAERIDRLFGALDVDGNGQIDRKELGDRLPGILQRLRAEGAPQGPPGIPPGAMRPPDTVGERPGAAGPPSAVPIRPGAGGSPSVRPAPLRSEAGGAPSVRPGPAMMDELQRRMDDRIERQVKEMLEKRLPEMIDRHLREVRERMRKGDPGRRLRGRMGRLNDAPAFRAPGRRMAPSDNLHRDPLAGPRFGPNVPQPRRQREGRGAPQREGQRGPAGFGGGSPAFGRPGRGPALGVPGFRQRPAASGAGQAPQAPGAGAAAFRMLDADRDGRLQSAEIRRLIGLLDRLAAESEREPMSLHGWQEFLGEHRPPQAPGPKPDPNDSPPRRSDQDRPDPDRPDPDRPGRGQRG